MTETPQSSNETLGLPRPDLSPDQNRFTGHPAAGDQSARYDALRGHGLSLVEMMRRMCPPSPELERAVDHIDDAVMLANAAIARHTDRETWR